GSPRKSPLKPSSCRPHVPVGSFYGRGKGYLDPLERKRLQEIQVSGMRSRDGNVPAAGRAENPSGNPDPRAAKHAPNPGNGGGNPNPRAAKHAPKPKGGRSVPKSRKSKAEIPVGKPRGEKEAGNCLVQKKMDSPFRVLSMKVKPALKLQLGAAFFAARKKSHSKKNPGDSKAPQALPKAPQEKVGPAEGSEAPEKRGELGRIPEAQEEGKENRESSGNVGDPGCAGKASPRKTGSVSCASEAGAAEDGPIPSWREQTGPLDEIPSPFGSSPPGKAPHASQKSRKAKELCGRSRDQMIIDAGQKHFGAIMCKSCGMIYSAASPEDEAQHLQHHQRFLEALRYVGWKKERVVAEFWDGKIVLILPTDPKYAVKKSGGSIPSSTCRMRAAEGRFLGSWAVQTENRSMRVSLCPPPRAFPAGPSRRFSSRSTFTFGSVLSSREIAFSDPTPHGKLLASSYCRTPNFLVYNFLSQEAPLG
ncbi:N-acetyltransferase ESCO2, partial [Empidonax traillii]|uniref:N-acetyltransferase ESCO2 n=1 Tax=Empidonax traillii TaxID=164674 RepID=UPI000FFDA789